MGRMLKCIFFLFAIQLIVNALNEHCEDDDRVNIYESEVIGEIEAIQWDGGFSIWAHTSYGVLYRSMDGGIAWSDQTSNLRDVKTNGDATPTSINHVITTGTLTTYFMGAYGDIWTTIDGGVTYRFSDYLTKNNQSLYGYFLPNPFNDKELLVRTASRRCLSYTASGYCFYSWYLTQDSGLTWTLLQSYSRFAAWGVSQREGGNKIFFDSSTKPHNGNQVNKIDEYEVYVTNDYGKTHEKVLDRCAGFVMKNGRLFLIQVDENGDFTLFVKTRIGNDPLKKISFPVDLKQTRFSILNTDGYSTFISVEHEQDDWGNLYMSDTDELSFSLSLAKNKRDTLGHVEFFELSGYFMNALFIANSYEEYDPNNVQDNVKTLMTYNRGGDWRPIPPPRIDSNGKPITCIECSLHLIGTRKTGDPLDIQLPWGPILSRDNAIGLVMATGNIGKYLSYDGGDINTYFSRDAGKSWTEVSKGSHVYDFADHGALIVMANNMQETNSIQYTWNEGLNWTTCRFSDEGTKFQIEDVVTEPNVKGLQFLLYGTKLVNGAEKGVIVYVDFENFHERECVHPNDYEVWTPSNPNNGDGCILGQTFEVTRRKQTSECYNSDEEEVVYITKRCPCTQEDYECDYCYEPYEGDYDQCVPSCDEKHMNQPPENCVGYYNVSRGYRLVAGDNCDISSGLDLTPIQVKCPSSGTTSGKSDNSGKSSNKSPNGAALVALIALLIIGALIMIIAVLMLLSKKNEKFREAFLSRVPNSISGRFKDVMFTRLEDPDEDHSLIDDEEINRQPNILDDEAISNYTKHPDDI